MGYEIKLIIVEKRPKKWGHPELKRSEKGQIDGEVVYFPYAKDSKGREIKTGRTEHILRTVAEIDLCCFRGKAIEKLDADNQKKSKADKKNAYKWFLTDGNTLEDEDRYGAKRNPIPVKDVLKAVEASHMESIHDHDYRYRRSEWAVALLKSIVGHQGDNIEVILYGH